MVSTIGIALGLAVLILPGLYLLVRWFVAPQASVAEHPGGPFATLRRSAHLTRGRFWHTAGIVVVIVFLGGVVSGVLALPFTLLAAGLDADALVLVGLVLGETVAISFTALVGTLVYFDLRARRGDAPPPGTPPPRAPAERGF